MPGSTFDAIRSTWRPSAPSGQKCTRPHPASANPDNSQRTSGGPRAPRPVPRRADRAAVRRPLRPDHPLGPAASARLADDALIQPYSGHATSQSLETYSRLALADAQQRYANVIGDFPF